MTPSDIEKLPSQQQGANVWFVHLMSPCFVADFERPASQQEGSAEQPSTSGSPRPSVYDLIWHATDASVKPIVANRRIERLPEPKWDARALPFKALVSFSFP